MGNQKDLLVEADFLADGTGKVCRRPREYVVTNRDFIVSPRATAQLEREIIEYASADEAAPSIDLDMLVHMLLSITSEQNMRPEFAGDVPTDAEVAKLQRELPKMGLEETHEYAKRLIPDEIASSLFNLPLKYCRTPTTCGSPRGRRDRRPPAWARRPPRHSRSPRGSTYLTPCASVRESSSAATTPIRSGSPAMNCSPTAPPRPRSIYLFANMALPPNDYKTKLQEGRDAGAIGHQRYTLTRFPFLAVDDNTFRHAASSMGARSAMRRAALLRGAGQLQLRSAYGVGSRPRRHHVPEVSCASTTRTAAGHLDA